MRRNIVIAASLAVPLLFVSACNKSSPPPQEPVKPRLTAAIEKPLQLPAP